MSQRTLRGESKAERLEIKEEETISFNSPSTCSKTIE